MTIVFWLVALVALAACAGLALRLALAVPAKNALAGGAHVLPDSLPAADAARTELAALVPSGDAIVGGPPPISSAPLLDGVQPGVALRIDLNLVGVEDDRDAVDRDLWLASKDALAKRRGNKGA